MFWCKIILILGLFFCTDGQYDYECPKDFVLVSNNCYYFSSSADTWRNAYFNCKDKNSELVLPKKKWQDKLLRSYLKTGEVGWVDRWIGAIYDWKRMLWVWGSSGQPLRYRGFAKRVRKNLTNGNHQWKCISMNPRFKFRWQPKNCTVELHYICEVRPNTNYVTK